MCCVRYERFLYVYIENFLLLYVTIYLYSITYYILNLSMSTEKDTQILNNFILISQIHVFLLNCLFRP